MTHDDDAPHCACDGCAALERETRMRAACTYGGLAPLAHELLGPGWLDEIGGIGTMADEIATLAQRALGETFEQLERIGALGRAKCAGSKHGGYFPPPPPASREELRRLLRLVDELVPYATVQLGYLPPEPLPGHAAEEPEREAASV